MPKSRNKRKNGRAGGSDRNKVIQRQRGSLNKANLGYALSQCKTLEDAHKRGLI